MANKPQFKEVKASVSYPEMEEKLMQLWRDKQVRERSVSEREGRPPYVFFEGPPTAEFMRDAVKVYVDGKK